MVLLTDVSCLTFLSVRSVIRGAIPKFADLRELHRLTYVGDGIKIEVI